MKKKLPKDFWTIFLNAIHNAEDETQLKELQLNLDKLKNSGYVKIFTYKTVCDEIKQKRIELQTNL